MFNPQVWLCLLLFTILSVACTERASDTAASDEQPQLEVNVAAAGSATFLALSDIHLDPDTRHAWYHRNSETRESLLDSAVSHARALINQHQPTFVVYLGDMPGHNQSKTDRFDNFQRVLQGLREIVSGTHIPLLFLPGNNDAIGYDYSSWTDLNGLAGHPNARTPFDADSGHQSEWPVINGKNNLIDTSGLSFCYYSSYPLGSGLRVIMMNTVMLTSQYASNDGVSQQAAVDSQFQWLEGQLAEAKKQSDQVLIAMHVPPGKDGHRSHNMWDSNLTYSGETAQTAFLKMINCHKGRVVGILTGHTHTDGIRILQNCHDSSFVELAISIPGVTTDHGNNPGIKVFTYRTSDYELLDFTTHYATERTHDWEPSQTYSFIETYHRDIRTSLTMFSVLDSLCTVYGPSKARDTIGTHMLDVLMVGHGSTSTPEGYRRALSVEWQGSGSCDCPAH